MRLMKYKNKTVLLFSLILFLLIIDITEAAVSFKAWAASPVLFTLGKTELVNIYVQNMGETDRYNITYTKNATKQGIKVPQLIGVSMPSYSIKELNTSETGDTFAKITILGPIDAGNITFKITSKKDSLVYHETSVDIKTGLPVVLQEFGLFGIVQILILVTLVLIISYASYLS